MILWHVQEQLYTYSTDWTKMLTSHQHVICFFKFGTISLFQFFPGVDSPENSCSPLQRCFEGLGSCQSSSYSQRLLSHTHWPPVSNNKVVLPHKLSTLMTFVTKRPVGGSFNLLLSHERLGKGLRLWHAAAWPSSHFLRAFEDEGDARGIWGTTGGWRKGKPWCLCAQSQHSLFSSRHPPHKSKPQRLHSSVKLKWIQSLGSRR